MLAAAAADVGQREATGNNDGPFVENCLRTAGRPAKSKDPWCGAWMAKIWHACRLAFPAGAAGARNWFLPSSVRTYFLRGHRGSPYLIRPADAVGFYNEPLGRIGHIALVEKVTPTGFITIEGNTNPAGSREGGGVYRLRRSRASIYAAANHID